MIINHRSKRQKRIEYNALGSVYSWLSIRLDESIFDCRDLHSRMLISQIEENRINKEVDRVVCRAFIGGRDGRQLVEFNAAVGRAKLYFLDRGIKLDIKLFDQDTIINVLEWTPTELVDRFLEADFHIFITHLHEGSIAKNGSWNMFNILANLDRLKYHLGNLMGSANSCSIYRQGKREVYEKLHDYCLPTITVELPRDTWDNVNPLSNEDTAKVYG